MEVVIDRFEGEIAIVELPDKRFAEIALALLPGAEEGDVVEITLNQAKTEMRKKEIHSLMESVWEE